MLSTDDPLVSTDWLAAHIDDPKVKIIDASFKLPGVLPLPMDDYLTGAYSGRGVLRRRRVSDHSNNPLPHMFPAAEQFAPRRRRAWHFGNGDTVVAYDSGGWVAAPRAWWMFLSFGHRDVRSARWRLEEMAAPRDVRCIAARSRTKPATFKARLDARRVRSHPADDCGNLESRAEQVIDARSGERFEGRGAEPRPGLRSGHIPGSRNLPYDDLFDAATGAMKPLDELRQGVRGRRRRHDATDRDELRLRRFGAGADARALPAGRRKFSAI